MAPGELALRRHCFARPAGTVVTAQDWCPLSSYENMPCTYVSSVEVQTRRSKSKQSPNTSGEHQREAIAAIMQAGL